MVRSGSTLDVIIVAQKQEQPRLRRLAPNKGKQQTQPRTTWMNTNQKRQRFNVRMNCQTKPSTYVEL